MVFIPELDSLPSHAAVPVLLLSTSQPFIRIVSCRSLSSNNIASLRCRLPTHLLYVLRCRRRISQLAVIIRSSFGETTSRGCVQLSVSVVDGVLQLDGRCLLEIYFVFNGRFSSSGKPQIYGKVLDLFGIVITLIERATNLGWKSTEYVFKMTYFLGVKFEKESKKMSVLMPLFGYPKATKSCRC